MDLEWFSRKSTSAFLLIRRRARLESKERTRTSLRAPSNFDNGDTVLLRPLDITIHDLYWLFNEVKLVINMYLIQQNTNDSSDKHFFKLDT
nr:hypothetical protein [Tanacetum cinerariifolium]